MIIHPPMMISPRLLPAVEIDDVTISIDPEDWTVYFDGRGEWSHIDYVEDNFRPGLLPRDEGDAVRDALGSVLSFVSAFAEAIEFETRTGCESENSDLFPDTMREWAHQNSDEITDMAMQLEDED